MKYYHFKKGEKEYSQQLESSQCIRIKDDGHQCRNRVVIGGNLCHVHRKSVLHLTIKPSTIAEAGDGLFCFKPKAKSNIVFKKGDKICDYNGEIINGEVLYERYGDGNSDYAMELFHQLYEDASVKRGLGSLANWKKNHANAKLSIKRNNRAQLLATKNIRHDDEIFLAYSRSYRLGKNDISKTNSRKNM